MRDIRELFPTDDPVRPDLLIGRARDVRDLSSHLETGTHVVMAGPRRTGKSTVALAALERVRSSDHLRQCFRPGRRLRLSGEAWAGNLDPSGTWCVDTNL